MFAFAMDYLNRAPAMQAWQVAMPLALSLFTKLPFVGAQYDNTTDSVTTSSSSSTDEDIEIALPIGVVGVGIVVGVAYSFWRRRHVATSSQTSGATNTIEALSDTEGRSRVGRRSTTCLPFRT
jgi:hypothetical protein